MSDIIAAIATGSVPSAIGILRLSGDGCSAVADRVFRLKSGLSVTKAEPKKMLLGELYDTQGRVIDHAMLVYAKAPHSYTGEDTVEIQCHGAPAVLAAGLEALFQAGARQAAPGEFTRRAFLNGRLDLTGAEAVADLIDAETADAAANAAGQLGGAILRRIDPIYQSLTDICSHYHAVLDYPDEDIPDFRLRDFEQVLLMHSTALGGLLNTCERGKILKQGVRIALLGRPNVGKSSLLNALAGFERVIVTEIAGTTRDTVEETVRFGKVLARLTDTAGIRQTDDRIESAGVERSRDAARSADLAIFVCDGSEELNEDDRQAIRAAGSAKKSIAVINKSDLPQRVFRVQLPFAEVLTVSAKDGTGIGALGNYIEKAFANDLPCDGGILTNARQTEAIRRGKDAIGRAVSAIQNGITPDAVLTDVELAMQAMGELIGKNVREDITQRIFERFCVGK